MSSKKDHKIWDAFLNHPGDYLKKAFEIFYEVS
jgi:hypothetical protein